MLGSGQEMGRRRADQVARKLLKALGCSGRGPGVSGLGTWTQPRAWGPPEPDSEPPDLTASRTWTQDSRPLSLGVPTHRVRMTNRPFYQMVMRRQAGSLPSRSEVRAVGPCASRGADRCSARPLPSPSAGLPAAGWPNGSRPARRRRVGGCLRKGAHMPSKTLLCRPVGLRGGGAESEPRPGCRPGPQQTVSVPWGPGCLGAGFPGLLISEKIQETK